MDHLKPAAGGHSEDKEEERESYFAFLNIQHESFRIKIIFFTGTFVPRAEVGNFSAC